MRSGIKTNFAGENKDSLKPQNPPYESGTGSVLDSRIRSTAQTSSHPELPRLVPKAGNRFPANLVFPSNDAYFAKQIRAPFSKKIFSRSREVRYKLSFSLKVRDCSGEEEQDAGNLPPSLS